MVIERHPFQFFLAGIADKLNPVEEENMIVEVSFDEEESLYIMNKTFAEIYEAMKAGTPCFMCYAGGAYVPPEDIDSAYTNQVILAEICMCYKYDTVYRVNASINSHTTTVGSIHHMFTPAVYVFQVSSSDEYPTFYRTVYANPANCTTSTNFIA